MSARAYLEGKVRKFLLDHERFNGRLPVRGEITPSELFRIVEKEGPGDLSQTRG